LQFHFFLAYARKYFDGFVDGVSMYAGLKHSSCCQYINEKGLSMSDLQTIWKDVWWMPAKGE
jgi:hypothetical protein